MLRSLVIDQRWMALDTLDNNDQFTATALVWWTERTLEGRNRSINNRTVVCCNEPVTYKPEIKYVIRVALPYHPSKSKGVYTALSELWVVCRHCLTYGPPRLTLLLDHKMHTKKCKIPNAILGVPAELQHCRVKTKSKPKKGNETKKSIRLTPSRREVNIETG